MQQKANDNKKKYNRFRNLLQKRVLEKRRSLAQFLVTNGKRTKNSLDAIKSLGRDSQKQK